jgi:uncharacterized protein YbjT (DUF2867 family)
MANKKKSATQRTVLIAGATGKQGGATMRHLRERGFPVRAMTRNPDKPEARKLAGPGVDLAKADMLDPASLLRALESVYGVFGVQARGDVGVEGEVAEGKNLVNAARSSGVSHFVYSSVGSADQNTGIPHFDSKFQIEQHLRGSGLPFTILRPVFFMENLLGMLESLRQGTLALPLSPDRRLQMIAVDDIGALAATAFEHPQKWLSRELDIAGADISMTDLAALLSRALGLEVSYRQVPWEDFEKAAGRDYTLMFRWFEDVGYHADISALRQEYPRLTSIERWVQQQNWGLARGA